MSSQLVSNHKFYDMTQELDKWLEEVAEQCHEFAIEIDLDFYCFQSPLPTTNPETVIIGINPGGYGKYSGTLEKHSINKRSKNLLSQSINIYSVIHPCEDNKVMVGKLSRVFYNDFLQNTLEDATIFNMYYFNTRNVESLNLQLSNKIRQYCIEKSKELLEILKPQHIIFLCTANSQLVNMGVTHIKGIGNYVKTGVLNGRKIIALPNPGFFKAYSYENGAKMGEHLQAYLMEK